MSKPRYPTAVLPDNLAPHVRYGSRPIASGQSVPEATIRFGHWSLSNAVIFPESVVAADIERQNYALYPRRYYVDMLSICRSCGRPFLFFALEQQHWYEELGFYVDANCVTCQPCRHKVHAQQDQLKRFSQAIRDEELSRGELMTLVDDAADLLIAGVLRDRVRLGALKNRALRECAEHPGTTRLTLALKQLERDSAMTEKPTARGSES